MANGSVAPRGREIGIEGERRGLIQVLGDRYLDLGDARVLIGDGFEVVRGSVVLAAFLIGFGKKDNVAREFLLFFRDTQYRFREYRNAAFEIDGAASVDVTVFDDSGEGIEGPFLAFNTDHIGVRRDENRLLAAIAPQPRDEVGLGGIGSGDDVDFKAQWRELRFQKRRHLRFVTGRVAGIDADQFLEQERGVVQRRIGCARHVCGGENSQREKNVFESSVPLLWSGLNAGEPAVLFFGALRGGRSAPLTRWRLKRIRSSCVNI